MASKTVLDEPGLKDQCSGYKDNERRKPVFKNYHSLVSSEYGMVLKIQRICGQHKCLFYETCLKNQYLEYVYWCNEEKLKNEVGVTNKQWIPVFKNYLSLVCEKSSCWAKIEKRKLKKIDL